MKRERFDERFEMACPHSLRDALDLAADKHMTSASEYARRALCKQLRADGIEPAAAAA